MYSSIILLVVSVLFFAFFAVYKRDMLIKMFSININSSVDQLQEELEQTANMAVQRLEEKMSHLEYLLEEANDKIAILEDKIQSAEKFSKGDCALAGITEKQKFSNDVKSEEAPLNVVVEEKDQDTRTVLREETIKQESTSDKKQVILAMAEQGYNVTEIAKATGMGKGAIMLLLQLKNKK